jgi:CheY-like chemotaxis protein
MPDSCFLIVDPSPAVLTFIRKFLEGYGLDAASVRTASCPTAAIEEKGDTQVDFLLTDWFAKEATTGIALHEAIVVNSPACRLALLSQAMSPAHELEAQRAGALFLLRKPFTADELRTKLIEALDKLGKSQLKIPSGPVAQRPSQERPLTIRVPALPHFKPGDQVSYLNRRETVQHVILRRGELVVQLLGHSGLIEAAKIRRV